MDGDQDKKTTEVRQTNKVQGDTNIHRETVESSQAIDGRVITQRVIYYLAGVITALLAIRVVLQLLGANQGSAFVDFIYSVSGLFAWPFYGIFSYQPTYGQSTLEVSTIVAIIVYGLVAFGLAKLFTLTGGHDEV